MFHKIAILVAALAVIFPGELRCEQNGEPGVITGTVTYLQRMALPPDAVVDVQLRDVSLQDVPAKVIAESTIATAEKQVPIAFRIPFAIADINSAHIYAVGATITFGGNVMFSSTASYPVITRGAPTQIEIVVRPILAEEAPAHEAAHGLQVLKPVTFAGDLPCADCAGMRFTLTLRPDGIFLSRTNYRGKGKPFHDLGRWSLPNDGTRLVLFSGNHAPQLFAIKNADTLRLLDVEGHEIVSKLNYDLKRDVEVDPIGDTFRFTGEFVHVADAGLITECRTGARWPVAQEGDNPVLERAYSASGTGAGQPVLVTFEGHFVSRPRMEGSGEQEMIVIDQFAQLGLPDKRCVSHQAATQIEETEWRLVELNGSPLVAGLGAKQVNLLLRADGTKLTGSSGCNQMFGTYALEEETLRFKAMGMTMMACAEPLMRQEQAFLEALKTTSSYRLTDEMLELRDGERVLARFESKAR